MEQLCDEVESVIKCFSNPADSEFDADQIADYLNPEYSVMLTLKLSELSTRKNTLLGSSMFGPKTLPLLQRMALTEVRFQAAIEALEQVANQQFVLDDNNRIFGYQQPPVAHSCPQSLCQLTDDLSVSAKELADNSEQTQGATAGFVDQSVYTRHPPGSPELI